MDNGTARSQLQQLAKNALKTAFVVLVVAYVVLTLPFTVALNFTAVVVAAVVFVAAVQNIFFRSVSSKPIISPKIWGDLLLVSIVGKVLWVFLQWPTAPYDQHDLSRRFAYLERAVLSEDFGPDSLPRAVGKRFQVEWAIATLSMTGLAEANRAFLELSSREHAKGVLTALVKRMLQEDIREYEHMYWGWDALEVLCGDDAERDRGSIGYLGHLNLLLGYLRMVGGSDEFDQLHSDISEAFERRLGKAKSLFLETFPGENYVPDNLAMLASLALYDRSQGTTRYQSLLKEWSERCQQEMIDPESGLIVPWVDPATGKGIHGVRGSYAAWNLIYMTFIDEEFARSQWETAKKLLVTYPLPGVAALREFPHGKRGVFDIDSGPVLFGMSPSGTGFAMAPASYFGDTELLLGFLRISEIAGFSISSENEKYYATAPLIGEAIVLATRTANKWVESK